MTPENLSPPSWGELSRRLSRGSGVPEAEVVTWTAEAVAQLAAAPIRTYVPVLVEHIVRNRIAAAQAGPDGR